MEEPRLHTPRNWCITQSEIVPITFKWTIKNFSYHLKEVGYRLTSATFTSEGKDETKWHLEVYPKGMKTEFENLLSLYLVFEPDSIREATAMFHCSLLSTKAEKSVNGMKSELCWFNKAMPTRGYSKFMAITKLMDESTELLQDDNLTIYCEIKLVNASTTTSGKILNKKIPDSRYGDDFSKLFNNEFLSDVTLMACDRQFKVHKTVLAARSTFFAAMFSNEMKEKNQNVIEIGGISDDVLCSVLQFIYSDKTPEGSSMGLTSDLLVAADKYDLERLKVMCEKILIPQLAIENALDLLILADLHNAEELKEMAMNFVTTYAAEVKKRSAWISLVQNHPSLLDQIYNYHLRQGLKIKDASDA